MAGDWIKMRCDLREDPSVIGIAARTGLDEDAVVGKLHRIWSWADKHTSDGDASSVTNVWVDRHVGCEGFAQAMVDVGWLLVTSRGVKIPKFDRHMSESAKQRGLAANRMKRLRDGASVTTASPEKRREEKKREREKTRAEGPSERGTGTCSPPADGRLALPAAFDTPEVQDAFARWFAWLVDKRPPFDPVLTAATATRLYSSADDLVEAINWAITNGRETLSSSRKPGGGARQAAQPEVDDDLPRMFTFDDDRPADRADGVGT